MELDKKREELRDYLILSSNKQIGNPNLRMQSSEAFGNPDTTLVNGHIEESPNKNARVPTEPSSPISRVATNPSPMNLSGESGIDNRERSSSVDSALSKVSENLK